MDALILNPQGSLIRIVRRPSPELALDLAARFATPLFVYDLDLIAFNLEMLYTCFAGWTNTRIYYAMKANSNVSILKTLQSNPRSYVETVSPAEILLALKCGFITDRLMHTGSHMTDEEVDFVVKMNILINIDSISRLEKFGAAYPRSRVCIRFNPEVSSGECENVKVGQCSSKFGILLSELNKVLDIVRRYQLKVVGLHEHTGSGIANFDDFFAKNFPDLEFMNFGGGFKVPYKPDEVRLDYPTFGQRFVELFRKFCTQYGRELFLHFEPGKFIVAEAGSLLVRVNTLKNTASQGLVAGTDSGFPHLIRPMFYGAYHHIVNVSNPTAKEKVYDVCGNICESDYFAKDRSIAEIRENDVLMIENAGAYCYSMGSYYNLRAMPAEVVLKGNDSFLSRRKLTYQELVDRIVSESVDIV